MVEIIFAAAKAAFAMFEDIRVLNFLLKPYMPIDRVLDWCWSIVLLVSH